MKLHIIAIISTLLLLASSASAFGFGSPFDQMFFPTMHQPRFHHPILQQQLQQQQYQQRLQQLQLQQKCLNMFPALASTKFNIRSLDDGYVLSAPLPGVSNQHIRLDLDRTNALIKILAIRPPVHGCEAFVRTEELKKEFHVDDEAVDWDAIRGSLEDGELSIIVPKVKENPAAAYLRQFQQQQQQQQPQQPWQDLIDQILNRPSEGLQREPTSQPSRQHQAPQTQAPQQQQHHQQAPQQQQAPQAQLRSEESRRASSQPASRSERPAPTVSDSELLNILSKFNATPQASSSDSSKPSTSSNSDETEEVSESSDLFDSQGLPKWFHTPVKERVSMPNSKRHQTVGDDGVVVL